MSKSLRDTAPERKPSTPSKKRTATKSASKSSTNSARPWESPEWQAAVRQTPGLKPFFDNLESFVELPEGVAKLRSLFIGLGVSGKLIPQVADDQPASEVVLECEQLRKTLAADGKLSNRKRLPEVELSEQEFAAPLGWEWVRINHICDHRLGKMLDKAKNKGTPYPYLRNTNVQWHEFDLTDVKEMRFEEDELDVFEVRSGDLMVCEGGYPGRCAIWSGETSQMMFQKAIHRVRPLGGIKSKFILLRLWNDSQRGYLDRHFTGATIKHFTGKELARYAICLPPIAEQRRIVSKVEGLMSLCDTLEDARRARESVRERASRSVLASLTSAPRSLERREDRERPSAESTDKKTSSAAEPLTESNEPQGDSPGSEPPTDSATAAIAVRLTKTETLASSWQRLSDHFEVLLDQPETVPHLRQSILQLAVQGKLVPQDPSDEPASELLKKLTKRREELISNGDLKKSKIASLTGDDIDQTAAPHWEWARLNELVEVMSSGWSPACEPNPTNDESEWGVLKTTSVQSFVFWEHEHKRLPAHLEPRPEAEAKRGDLLITRAGPQNRVGISCLVREVRPRLMISDKIIRFHLIEPFLYDEFVALCLNAGISQEHIEKSKSGMAASQMNISQAKFRMTPIPIPPLAEQNRIVSKVSVLLSQCDELSARLRSRQSTTDALLTALIHQILEKS